MTVTAARAAFARPLSLACGQTLERFEIAYETYGTLSPAGDNAILVCHGLTGDQRAAGTGADGRAGWWDGAIGPGRIFDTDRYCVVCANTLGSFGGSTGPASSDPATGRPFGMRFPLLTIGDMVEATAALADHLGIARFHAMAGGCMGGFQVLEWMARHPHRVGRAIVISATPRTSAHNLALWYVLRRAIQLDPHWNGGDYYGGPSPDAGMALVSMIGALFWISRDVLTRRFGLRRLQPGPLRYTHDPEFAAEEFLAGIGTNAPRRLDANSLIYLTRAIDYFDLGQGRACLADAFATAPPPPTLLISYKDDWRYPPGEMDELRTALEPHGTGVHHVTLESPFGHGGFLRDIGGLDPVVRPFLA